MTFLDVLHGGFWHTTSAERFASILRCGFILPEPPIPDVERWGTGLGPDHYPYVRYLGGVSLFDFRDFDEIGYSRKCSMSMWRTFVPCRADWDAAIWIKVNPLKLLRGLIDGGELTRQWDRHKEWRHKIMPQIEAAHIGPLPFNAFELAYRYTRRTGRFHLLL